MPPFSGRLPMKNAIAISTLLLFGCALTTHGAERPNVVLIVCDDLNDYLGCMGGHPQAITPNMDKLADSGVLFSRAYSNNPICGPSRSSFMSGIYPHTSKNLWFDPPSENPSATGIAATGKARIRPSRRLWPACIRRGKEGGSSVGARAFSCQWSNRWILCFAGRCALCG